MSKGGIKWVLVMGISGGGWLLSGKPLQAQELLVRSFRVQAMGGSGVALVEDRDALFYNPAGLAQVKDLSLHLVSLNTEGSQDVLSMGLGALEGSSQLSRANLNTFVGKDLSLRAQGAAQLVSPFFSMAAIGDQQLSLRLKNLPLLQGSLGVQSTYGVQAGFGVPSFKVRRKRGEVLIGFAPKALKRSGGFSSVTMTDILTGNVVNYRNLINHFGSAVGLDFGLQYRRPLKRGAFWGLGLAWRDIGDTTFTNGAASQKATLTLGTGLAVRSSREAWLRFAADYADIGLTQTWAQKVRLGIETTFPFLRLSTGLYQGGLSYGAGLSFWLFELSFLSYREELGVQVGQDPERRYGVQLGLQLSL